ncbi:helix-turn-helix transcriptional regulator [Laspinema sp. D1]|uniref:Helix-turn-helix transcriptional regulator n=1 Tax=Laspinema palackyanum D2a TaxID=2953684 RepID=A0ABT2N0B5_9CYAN|nr:helix-turn-helix transcriptional regulator [Laspinema sp. D2a]
MTEQKDRQATPQVRLAQLVTFLGEVLGEPNDTALAQRIGIQRTAFHRLKAGESTNVYKRNREALVNFLGVTVDELNAYINGELPLTKLVQNVMTAPNSAVAFEQILERLPYLKFSDRLRLWEMLNETILQAFQPFRRHLDRMGMVRGVEPIADLIPVGGVQDLLIAEMRSRGLLRAENGWEILASESTLDAQRLRELASGAQPTHLDIVAIEALLESTRQPDGSPWSQSDLEALVERDFGGLADWEQADERAEDSPAQNGDPLTSSS